MIRQITLALIFSLIALSARAASSSCYADTQDPYSAGVPMPAGPHRGECIDTSQKRAIRILKHTEQGLWIANFRYENKFWNAWIPADSVDSVDFVFVDLDVRKLSFFGINIFHNHLRFHFKKNKPLILRSQFQPQNEMEARVDDVIVSMNYMAPKGVDYNPIKGFDSSEYLSVLQVYAMSDEANTRFAQDQDNVFGVRLRLTEDQAWRVLMAGLGMSHKEQYAVPYDTWDSNCALAAFQILDQALIHDYGKKVKPFRFSLWKLRDTNFVPALKALKERSLIHEGDEVKLVNTEFGYPRFPSRWKKY